MAARRSSSASPRSGSSCRFRGRRWNEVHGTMRLLIAGGGTGGHIYPALAVARSLSDPDRGARDKVELTWLGGHRGLERSIVRAAGIPIRRLALRSLRTVDRDVHAVDRAAARKRLGVGADGRVLLVFGGSQAVRRFNAAVAGALPRLVERLHVIHVTGEEGYRSALAAREALPAGVRDRYRPH